jgi:drug/metabolite transporter (DMT)-like permease
MLGLASAISWGGGDFCGGFASRRAPVQNVLVIGASGGLALLVVLALLWGEALPAVEMLLWGAAAGLFGTFGLVSLYRGLAIGQAAVVAPTSAVVSAALPVVFGAFSEGLPAPLQLLGFGVALLGIWLVAQTGEITGSVKGLGLAVLAGCGFGVFFVLIDRASVSSTFWPLVAARVVTVVLTLGAQLVQPAKRAPLRPLLGLALLSGALDVSGNLLFVLASQAGRLDVAAILASFYPASTVLLSRLVTGERISQVQWVGLVAVLIAIVLIVV